MCFDDGPGIRTTVFLQGCNLHCPWCCNPETQLSCEHREVYTEYNFDKIVSELLKDRIYWNNSGGVTFSGGEAMLQAKSLVELCKCLKKEGIHLTLESALFIERDVIELLIPYIDLWYVDVKVLDVVVCRNVLGGELNLFLNAVQFLASNNANIRFRMPCVKEVNMIDGMLEKNLAFLREYCQYPVELFGIHDLAREKYRRMCKDMKTFYHYS